MYFISFMTFLQSLHYIYMSLDRHVYKLQLDWLAEAYYPKAVILVILCLAVNWWRKVSLVMSPEEDL